MPQSKQMKLQWIEIDSRQVPAFLPQVWSEELQDWVVTSDINPLPVNDNPVLAKLEDLETEIKATNAKLDGTINTQLTGSNVEFIGAYEIDNLPSGVGTRIVTSLNISKYKYLFLHVSPNGLKNYEVRQYILQDDSTSSPLTRVTIFKEENSISNKQVDNFLVKTINTHLDILNNSEDDSLKSFKISVFGVVR